jgi:hypothetical protein
MGDIETVKVCNPKDPDGGHMIINKSDYREGEHELHEDNGPAPTERDTDEQRYLRMKDAERRAEANRGVTGGTTANASGRNPSGTFSEPTPTDIRFPNKDETEFENNHGAFVGKSAAQMREDRGLPDAAGGLAPDAQHVGKGPRGKWYVKKGTERTAGPFDTEDEAKAAMAGDDVADAEQSVEHGGGGKAA